MAVPSQQTVAVGQKQTATLWNDDVRDAVTYLLNTPACWAYNNANISIANNTATAVTFNSENYDDATNPLHSTVTNTSRLTVTDAGKYVVYCNAVWAANATGIREIVIQRTGGTVYAMRDSAVAAGEAHIQALVSPPIPAVAGDYFEMVVRQTSGGALNLTTAGTYSPSLAARWVST